MGFDPDEKEYEGLSPVPNGRSIACKSGAEDSAPLFLYKEKRTPTEVSVLCKFQDTISAWRTEVRDGLPSDRTSGS